jgi:tRNA nucleotidyltransferase (CCA-adding enzyme)
LHRIVSPIPGALNNTPGTAVLHPPRDVLWIAKRLEEAGFSAWTVGGAVRDALAGIEPGDWDLTTSATPAEVQRLFRRTVPIGVEHGTVGVVARSGAMYEVTTFRRDVETFGRRARVAFSDRLEEDLDRRDFTINAVAWHPLRHELRDPHGGIRDLQDGVLRTVGDPALRFAEDRLRVLRALRFAGRFGLRIETSTWQAIVASPADLGHLSAERIREELLKVLTGQSLPSVTLRLYGTSGVLSSLYPELEACRGVRMEGAEGDLWDYLLRTVDCASRARSTVRLAALFHRSGWAASADHSAGDPRQAAAAVSAAVSRQVLRRLRSSNHEVDSVTHLVAQHDPLPPADAADADLRRWVRRVGSDHLNDLIRLRVAMCRAGDTGSTVVLRLRSRVRALLREQPPLSIADLDIGGADLAQLGIPRGPLYGEILRDLLERVTDEPELNRRDILLDLVRAALDHPPG